MSLLLVNVGVFLYIFSFSLIDARKITQSDPNDIIVNIATGKILGKKETTIEQQKWFYSFKSIPYAEPPLGRFRFAPPVPQQRWNHVLNATQDPPSCVQSGNPVIGKEDCLFINVFTPQHPNDGTPLLPVMVWIYGGGFQAGAANYSFYGPDYFLDQDVVVVSFNYRLGIFGFLTTGDLVVPGNNGLKDQVMALKWVQSNIKTFGGDPQKVTIFGQSAGSASVAYLLESELTTGLFHGAIMESGVSLSPWAYSRHNAELPPVLAKDLGFSYTNSSYFVNKLRRFNYTYLQEKASAAATFRYLKSSAREGFYFGPVVEPKHKDAFLTEKSHVKLSQGQFQRVPCIVGYNSLEGTFDIGGLMRLILAKWDLEVNSLLPVDMNIDSFTKRTEAAIKIKYHYFGLVPAALSNVHVMKFIGDDQFVRPSREFVRLLSKYVKVYFYKYTYLGVLNKCEEGLLGPGVAHGAELGFMWRGYSSKACHPNSDDLKVRKELIKMWTNFAKTGNPTPSTDKDLDNIKWLPAKTSNTDEWNLNYLDIDKNMNLTMNPDDNDMKFWDQLYKQYAKQPFDTY